MPLEPGDRGILFVGPWEGLERDAEWRCARCSESSLSEDVWRVDYRHPEGGASSYLVCHDCADELEPVRLTIDVTTLRRVADEGGLSAVAELAQRTTEDRSSPATGVVSLRWADLHDLAQRHGLTPEQLAEHLEQAGALISRGQGFRRDFELPASSPEQSPPPA